MKIQDPRKLVTVELPSYPGSEVQIYNDLMEGQKIDLQSKYDHVIQSMLKIAGDQKDLKEGDIGSDIIKNLGSLEGTKIADLNEMNLYQICLAIKSWNLEDESGSIPITLESLKQYLMGADIEVLKAVIQTPEKKN